MFYLRVGRAGNRMKKNLSLLETEELARKKSRNTKLTVYILNENKKVIASYRGGFDTTAKKRSKKGRPCAESLPQSERCQKITLSGNQCKNRASSNKKRRCRLHGG